MARVALRSLFVILRSDFPSASVRQRIKRLRFGFVSATAWPNHSLGLALTPSRGSRRECSPALRAQYQTSLSRRTRGLWRVWRCVLCSLFSAASFQLHLFVGALSAFGLVAFPLLRGLTTRSTGPIAAGRHLGYKSLAQMPTRRNGPVSSNVRPQTSTAV